MPKYDVYLQVISTFLKSKKSALQVNIVEELKSKCDITQDNAKKILSNLCKEGKIFSSNPIVFKDGMFAYSLSKNKNIFKKILNSEKKYLYKIIGLLEKDYIISELDVLKISGSIISEKKHHNRDFYKIVEEIKYFIDDLIYDKDNSCFYKKEISQPKQKLEIYECKDSKNIKMIIPIIELLNKQHLINKRNLYYRSEKFSSVTRYGYHFDAITSSNATGFTIMDNEKKKDSLVLFDINLVYRYDHIDFDGFKERINGVKIHEKSNVIPIIVYKEITKIALELANNYGIICFDINDLFGKQVNLVLEGIFQLSLMNTKNEDQVKIKEKAFEILESIAKSMQDDNLGNLKGELFERIMIDIIQVIYQERGCQFKPKKLISKNNKIIAEVDLFLITNDECISFEFKGTNEKVKLGTFDSKTKKYEYGTFNRFYKHTFQYIKKNILHDDCKHKFCFISASGFTKQARDKLIELNQSDLKPEKLDCFLDIDSLKKLSNEISAIKKDVDLLEKYFKKELLEENNVEDIILDFSNIEV